MSSSITTSEKRNTPPPPPSCPGCTQFTQHPCQTWKRRRLAVIMANNNVPVVRVEQLARDHGPSRTRRVLHAPTQDVAHTVGDHVPRVQPHLLQFLCSSHPVSASQALDLQITPHITSRIIEEEEKKTKLTSLHKYTAAPYEQLTRSHAAGPARMCTLPRIPRRYSSPSQ